MNQLSSLHWYGWLLVGVFFHDALVYVANMRTGNVTNRQAAFLAVSMTVLLWMVAS